MNGLGQFTNEILTILGLVVLNGIFASMEIAVLTLNEARLLTRVEEGDRVAGIVYGFRENSSEFLGTIQIAITASGFLASATGAATLAVPLAALINGLLPVSAALAQGLSIVVVTLAITFLTLVFGELVPKRLGLQRPYAIAYALARPAVALAVVLRPVNWLLTLSTNKILDLVGVGTERRSNKLTEDEMRRIVRDQAVLPDTEKDMIRRVLDFGDHLAREIMVPRTEMRFVTKQSTIREAAVTAARFGFSWLPVVDNSVDNIVGMVAMRDLLKHLLDKDGEERVDAILRKAFFFPDTKETPDLLAEMRKLHTHMAILVDEYGGVAGLVTIEDLVEEIVGEIRGPFDVNEPVFEKRGEGTYLVDGRMDLEEVNLRLGLKLSTTVAYETISGFINNHLGRVPSKGDVITVDQVRYEVYDIDDKSIDTVLITVDDQSQ